MLNINYVSFDSKMLGGKVYRLSFCHGGYVSKYGHREKREIIDFVKSEKPLLVTCRMDPGAELANIIKSVGFYYVETLVTLEARTRRANNPLKICRFANPQDMQACLDITPGLFASDRYHCDPNVDNTLADALKLEWVRNSFSGRADKIFIADRGERGVCGYNICRKVADVAVIDLIGVASSARRQGIGVGLIEQCLESYQSEFDKIRVGTQAINHSALKVYQRSGFKEVSRLDTYHLFKGARV